MQEVRLIDANALKAEARALGNIGDNDFERGFCWGVDEVVNLIESAPTIKPEVRHGKGCEYCKGRSYTKKPLTVTTRTMKRVEVCFNFCPNCGRDMRVTGTNVGGKGGTDNG